ncbi:Cys-tRNA(Pro) deacylase [Anaerobacillus sp. CMMVII]|uniref:Cys-tRNA(Pro) deacylase n=1 Tax=Anaerobacillus sp. CMMVII TaxID=2755588 RepID=UPI0021B70F81|nr:Cys-tRNA(Pro) deacylase [Anaerobacillus sp. CMMVII]MCT8138228.1 Cys-tRNA(Pro) deacylase [Anaerobacillus sp. CMMVII]
MAKEKKTNAMRLLDKEKITYETYTYDSEDGKIDGVSVAHKISKDIHLVYKTLVAKGASKEYFVYIVPVWHELDLKKAAKAVGEKKIELIPVKDILGITGYIRGGCSPVGMKKLFHTVIDASAESLPSIIVSGGKIGIQIELAVEDLLKVTKGALAELVIK